MPASQLIAFRPPMQKGLQVHTVLCGLILTGCLSPITLNRAVVVYDEAVTDALAKQLLINIARAQHHQPIHFTGVSNIAATFDFRVNAGATPALTGEASRALMRHAWLSISRADQSRSVQAHTWRVRKPHPRPVPPQRSCHGRSATCRARAARGRTDTHRATRGCG